MSKILALVLTLIAVLAPSVPAHASILFGPAIRYDSTKTTDQTTGALGGGNSDTNALVGDGHLGILIEGTPIYIGGMYTYESSTASSTSSMQGSSYGPTFGLFQGAFSILGTYLMNAERTYTAGSVQNKLTKGTGFRVDVSYVAGLTGSIGVGPQIIYQSVKYMRSQAGSGTESDNTFETSGIHPGVVFWFRY